MNDLTFKPDTAGQASGDRRIAVPTLDDAGAPGAAGRSGASTRAVRRRFSATRLAHPIDDGFRPFRVF
jgi:hypothetical protein